jgi:hypothetical protein
MDRFKVGLLVLGVVFLALYFFYSNSDGRYQIGYSLGATVVIDTRTGVIYEKSSDMVTITNLVDKEPKWYRKLLHKDEKKSIN